MTSLIKRNTTIPTKQTQGQRGNIKQQQVRHCLAGVTSQDSGLNSSSISYSLIRVNALIQLLAIEEILQQLLNLGNPSGATDQHDVVDGGFVQLSIPHSLLN